MPAERAPAPIVCSVVIVTYNRAHWLRRCVDSVRGSGIRSLEIVVVDDGSTDDTPEVARHLGMDVRYYRQRNAGVAAARNRGARECRGRYLAFLDSDDRWLPDVPRSLVELMEAHPDVAVGFGDTMAGDSQAGYHSVIEGMGETFRELPCRKVAAGFRILARRPFFRAVARRPPVFIGATILRRAVFDESGGLDEDLNGCDDWELWMRLASTYTFAYYDRPLAVWERHAGNMSADVDHMDRDRITALGKILSERLPLTAEDRGSLRAHRARLMAGWAYQAFDRGDLPSARERFAAYMQTCGMRPGPLFYWCCSWLTPETVRGLRALKWRMDGVRARGRRAVIGR